MNPAELPLKDIHIPEAIGWWPPAIGWWAMVVLLPLLILLLLAAYKRITRKTAVKAAKKSLRQIQSDNEQTDYQKLCAVSVLLRRTAISCYPRSQAAALTGNNWLLFLDQAMPDKPFSEGPGKLLIAAPYKKPSGEKINLDDLLRICEDWLQAVSGTKK